MNAKRDLRCLSPDLNVSSNRLAGRSGIVIAALPAAILSFSFEEHRETTLRFRDSESLKRINHIEYRE